MAPWKKRGKKEVIPDAAPEPAPENAEDVSKATVPKAVVKPLSTLDRVDKALESSAGPAPLTSPLPPRASDHEATQLLSALSLLRSKDRAERQASDHEAHPDAAKWRTPATFDKWLENEAKQARERMKAANALAESRGAEFKDEDPYTARRAFMWSRMASRYVEGVAKYTWVNARRVAAAKVRAKREFQEKAKRAAMKAKQEKADAERKPPADPRAVGMIATFGGVLCAVGFPAVLVI
jgi:hypothetical protein